MGRSRETFRFRGRRPPAPGVWVLALLLAGCVAGPAPGQTTSPPGATVEAGRCEVGLAGAASRNRAGLTQLAFAPFHRPEIGWAVYEPLIAHEIATACGGATPAFAARLAAWQSSRGLPKTGVLDAATFTAMQTAWALRRPFVVAMRHGCPPPPPEVSLAVVPPRDSYGGKTMRLRAGALDAYDRMRAAARVEIPQVGADPRLMTLFSAYRSPESDAARCASEGNCQGVVRASCSAHRTGLAMDLYLGAAPGSPPDSASDDNRLYISQGAAYHWMVSNAGRFGFLPYPFEPWHWEWTGEPI